jgi:hypothetical protein
MINNNQAFAIKLQPTSIREIERIVDLICDQLFINDTYYGSILTSLTEVFALLLSEQHSESFNVEYRTDYQVLTISIYPVDKHIIARFELPVNIDSLKDTDEQTGIFLIKSLVDELITKEENIIELNFDISALHNEIYNHRVNLLKKYFNINKDIKVSRNNDQL